MSVGGAVRKLSVVLAIVAVAAAVAVRRLFPDSGGTVVVEADERVDGLAAFAGTLVVRGTVDGDVRACAGTIRIDGTVRGDVRAWAGTVSIDGTVAGSVRATAGTVDLGDDGVVDGELVASAGAVDLDGRVGGDVDARAGVIALGDGATLDGGLRYAGNLDTAAGASIGGEVRREGAPRGAGW